MLGVFRPLANHRLGYETALRANLEDCFPAGLYSVLAGFVEPGETLEECVVREVREEVGIDVSRICLFPFFLLPWTIFFGWKLCTCGMRGDAGMLSLHGRMFIPQHVGTPQHTNVLYIGYFIKMFIGFMIADAVNYWKHRWFHHKGQPITHYKSKWRNIWIRDVFRS